MRRDAVPPAWLRKLETVVLMRGFGRALGVETPSLAGLSAADALATYRAFTAACLGMATENDEVARYVRRRLGEEARALGAGVRAVLGLRGARALDAACYAYRGIGIVLAFDDNGREARFGPCSFAVAYTPVVCQLMSGFDEGFLRGITGHEDARLVFSCRLTEGAPCCRARFARVEDAESDRIFGREEGIRL